MKKHLVKILILALILTMMVPAVANAASSYYTITVSISDGTNTVTTDAVNASATATMVSAVGTYITAKTSALKENFPGSPLADAFDQLNSDESYWSTFWSTYGSAIVVSLDDSAEAENVKSALSSNRNITVAELADHANATNELKLFYNAGPNYELTLKFVPYNPGSYVAPVEPSPSAAPAEEPVVVDASDATEGEPVVVEEAVEVADSAEEAQEIVFEDIPEDVKELSVEVALEAAEAAEGAEPAEVSENTTVLAVKDKDGNVKIIPMAVVEIDEDGNITAKGSLNEELTELLKDGGSLIAYDNEQEEFEDVKAAVEEGTVTQEEADAVAYWQARGVTEGVGGGNLGGIDEEVSRARFATLLYRAFGEPETEGEADYADLTGRFAYAKDAATWAAEAGLMNGIGNDEEGNPQFGTGPIEAWQMALIMYRALGNNDSSDGYSDSWNWAVANGLVSGDKDATPDMPALLLMMKNLATYLDGAKMEGDSELETAALED